MLDPFPDYNLYFLLGAGTDERSTQIRSIEIEIEKVGDLVIGNFSDTYDNLPIKTYLGYQEGIFQPKISNHVVIFTDNIH